MRLFFRLLAVVTLLSGCSGSTPAETPAATTQPSTEPFVFVSDPALKELMAKKVEILMEALWNANLEETAPRTDADWKKFENTAKDLIEAGEELLEPPLAKDQGKWKEETRKMLDRTGVALQAIKEKNLKALNDTTNQMTEDACTSCHKLYYTGPQN
jgi:hypothetical protein